MVPVTIFGLGLGKTPVASPAGPTARYSGFAEKLLETFKEPMVWAPVLAFALVLFDVKIPPILGHGLSLLSHASGGVAIFACGIDGRVISQKWVNGGFSWGKGCQYRRSIYRPPFDCAPGGMQRTEFLIAMLAALSLLGAAVWLAY